MSYRRFGAMIATSVVVMFGIRYLSTYQWSQRLVQRNPDLDGALMMAARWG